MDSNEKQLSSKSEPMIKAGGSGDGSGPTSSTRTYPKGGAVGLKADFNPMNDKKRGATDWAVGGV